MDFINFLKERKSSFPAPEEARDKAKACDLLSRDIYKDSTRFVYELLQNADDASCKNESLFFQIDFFEDYLIVSHKGDPFTENDIESICSIGDGMKSSDVDQTGFKGIGFKSVFAHAELVIIKSGDYCFKFDKQASKIWDSKWGDQTEWELKRKSKGKDSEFCLPWQVIPMNAELPDSITGLQVVKDPTFAVCTILKCRKLLALKEAIYDLFSRAQLILFLRSENVTIQINGNQQLCIEKKIMDGVTTVLRNGHVINQWLIKTTMPFDVPERIKAAMSDDKDHYPEKLREATKTSMSFAVAIVNGRLSTIDDDYQNIFAFLPTSISKYKMPFVVNANFVTDAGRQSLHEDYVWNQWLFAEMPKHFLKWMVELAIEDYYGLDYLNLIAIHSGNNDKLAQQYDIAMQSAISSIAFLQSSTGQLLLAKDAVWDQTGISDCISKELLLEFINRNGDHYNVNSFLPQKYGLYERQLRGLGVFVFAFENLSDFMTSPIFISRHSVSGNAKLIGFFHTHYPDVNTTVHWLKNLTFIYSNHNTLVKPTSVCIPSTQHSSEYSRDLDYINESVFNSLSQETISWLMQLGVKEPTDVSLVETGKVFEEGFITSDNAIDVLRYLFELHKKEKLKYQHYKYLNSILVLTTNGTLMRADSTYMSDDYRPSLPLEKYVDIDFFISNKYIDWRGTASEWSTFLEKIGVKYDLDYKLYIVPFWDAYHSNYIFTDYLDEISQTARKYTWISKKEADGGWTTTGRGFYFQFDRIEFHIIPYLNYATQYSLSRAIWDNIITRYKDKASTLFDNNMSVSGITGPWGPDRTLDCKRLQAEGLETSYLRWVLNNKPVIPASDHQCHLAKEVYSNTIPNAQLIAGPFLPVIDIAIPLNSRWEAALGLKTNISIDDCLTILAKISNGTELTSENKSRIQFVYERLIELGALSEYNKDKIVSWGQNNKILSKDDAFASPSDLSHITLDGFRSKSQVYIGNPHNKAKVIQLLSLMGVTVISEDSVRPVFVRDKEKEELKEILRNKLSALALVSIGEKADRNEYLTQKNKLASQLELSHFYNCETITLSYGNADDVINKNTFAKKNAFYYTGNLRPANVEPLLTPLCKYLDIRGKERELFLILIEDMNGVRQNLKEKGYDVSLLEQETIPESGNIQIHLPYTPGMTEQERNIITGFKGEIIVYEKLKSLGYNPTCPSISTEANYTHIVTVNGKTYYCLPNFERFDISFVTSNGHQVFVEVKSTTSRVGQIENMPISSNEWSMIDECSNQQGKSYYLARVFGVDRPEQDVYIFKSYSNMDGFNEL